MALKILQQNLLCTYVAYFAMQQILCSIREFDIILLKITSYIAKWSQKAIGNCKDYLDVANWIGM